MNSGEHSRSLGSITSCTMINASPARQQPGSACDECRRKKERCDRQRPRCGHCEKAQIVCRFNEKRHPLRKSTRYTTNEIKYRLAQSEYPHIDREQTFGSATLTSISQGCKSRILSHQKKPTD
ncbi:hypothetical protein F5Y08DRAFT_2993 [Xylaria arbuscula]|nr:hypothetical protein F5Y08DRAFT_2993 [Xylaria arbuscula]